MKVKGIDVTKTMMLWGYLFTLSVFLLTGAGICAILTLIGLPFLWGVLLYGGLFLVIIKLLLGIDKDFQAELQKGREDEKNNGLDKEV